MTEVKRQQVSAASTAARSDSGTLAAKEITACCAAAYSRDAVTLLLGDSYHPGGMELTRQLARSVGLRPGVLVADIGSGPGATAHLIAREFGVTVDGVDVSAALVQRARGAVALAGRSEQVRFQIGEADRLPLPDSTFDAVFCECAFSLFPDKAAAAAELARILRPGGRLGFSDVVVTGPGLPRELTTLTAWLACLADARPLAQYQSILAAAGLRTIQAETTPWAAQRMIDDITVRMRLLRLANPQALTAAGVNPDAVLDFAAQVRTAIDAGLLSYATLVAEK